MMSNRITHMPTIVCGALVSHNYFEYDFRAHSCCASQVAYIRRHTRHTAYTIMNLTYARKLADIKYINTDDVIVYSQLLFTVCCPAYAVHITTNRTHNRTPFEPARHISCAQVFAKLKEKIIWNHCCHCSRHRHHHRAYCIDVASTSTSTTSMWMGSNVFVYIFSIYSHSTNSYSIWLSSRA